MEKTLQRALEFMTRDEISFMFNRVYVDICTNELVSWTRGLNNVSGEFIFNTLKDAMNPVLVDFMNEIQLHKAENVSAYMIDSIKDAELLFIKGYDIDLTKIMDNKPDALFKSVCYSDFNPNEDELYPDMSSIIVVGCGSPCVTNDTEPHIISHEIIHFIFEYAERILHEDFVTDIKANPVVTELLCDLLPYYYKYNADISSAVILYSDYAKRFIKDSVIEARKKYMDMILEL